VNRAPFDLAEAESELVAGFHTEYSGLRWSIFFMAEYGSMLSVSLLASILFMGGWNGPIPVAALLGLSYENGPVLGYLGALLGLLNLLAKGFLGVTVMMWVRWTLPRLRIDQVMTTCLKYCTPIAAVMFLGAALWQVNFLTGVRFPSPNHWFPAAEYGVVHEPLPEAVLSEAGPAHAAEPAEDHDGLTVARAPRSEQGQ
jgi:NADH-quinone oxidoreductase subunit H